MRKRLKQLGLGGAVLAALALGGPASASAEKTTTRDAVPNASAAPLTRTRASSAGAMHHVRDAWIRDLYLTGTSNTSDTKRV